MDPSVTALVLGLAGLVATLLSSSLGLYFTAKARTSPLREHLYREQVELTLRILRTSGRAKLFAAVLADEDSPHLERAREDLRRRIMELARLSDSAAAILPTELYVEVRRLANLFSEYSEAFDEKVDLTEFPGKFAGHMGKTAILARTYLGVDQLSAESARLFTTKRKLKEIAATSPEEVTRIIKAGAPNV